MSHVSSSQSQRGFTLIELLLYVSIVGTLLISVSLFFATAADSRIKNQSVSEVNQQGNAAMELITQTIRGATSITSPAAGATGSTLSLNVPTASLSPTLIDLSGTSTNMGYSTDGGSTDTSNSNFINATKFTAGATGTVSALYAMVGSSLGASPNNKAQMAIYSGTSTAPTTLLASSSDVSLTASTWNAFPISAVSVTSGQVYWLSYNTNGTASTQNNLRYHTAGANQSVYTSRTYGTWPSAWPGGTNSTYEFSMYAPIVTGGGSTAALQIKEGTGGVTPLTNDKVLVSGLTFKNLTRSGTDGVLQVSFTVSRVNSSGKNEYDYQKTFTGTAAIP
ncbi:MAG TPA: type II secretion system protein [Candidatus Saccharimonadales bacterium]